jgi:hypothetical protein
MDAGIRDRTLVQMFVPVDDDVHPVGQCLPGIPHVGRIGIVPSGNSGRCQIATVQLALLAGLPNSLSATSIWLARFRRRC